MRVVQLIPSSGWTANFVDEQTHLKGDTRPVVCWALLEDGSISGMVVDGKDIRPVSEMDSDFSSYHCQGNVYGL